MEMYETSTAGRSAAPIDICGLGGALVLTAARPPPCTAEPLDPQGLGRTVIMPQVLGPPIV